MPQPSAIKKINTWSGNPRNLSDQKKAKLLACLGYGNNLSGAPERALVALDLVALALSWYDEARHTKGNRQTPEHVLDSTSRLAKRAENFRAQILDTNHLVKHALDAAGIDLEKTAGDLDRVIDSLQEFADQVRKDIEKDKQAPGRKKDLPFIDQARAGVARIYDDHCFGKPSSEARGDFVRCVFDIKPNWIVPNVNSLDGGRSLLSLWNRVRSNQAWDARRRKEVEEQEAKEEEARLALKRSE